MRRYPVLFLLFCMLLVPACHRGIRGVVKSLPKVTEFKENCTVIQVCMDLMNGKRDSKSFKGPIAYRSAGAFHIIQLTDEYVFYELWFNRRTYTAVVVREPGQAYPDGAVMPGNQYYQYVGLVEFDSDQGQVQFPVFAHVRTSE